MKYATKTQDRVISMEMKPLIINSFFLSSKSSVSNFSLLLPHWVNPVMYIATLLKKSESYVLLNFDFEAIDYFNPSDEICKCGKIKGISLTMKNGVFVCPYCLAKRVV